MATAKTKAAAPSRQKHNPPAPPAPVLGAQLRAAREARDLSIDTVADELMIRKYYLEALEAGQYGQLPERVYAVGFVANYAQLLSMDPDAMVELFKREAYGGRGAAAARMELSMPTPVSQSMLPNRNTLFIIGAALLILIVSGIIWSTRAPHATNTNIPQPPAVADNDALNSVPAANAPVPDTTAIVSSTGTVTTDNPDDVAPPDFAAPAPSPASAATPTASDTSDTVPAPATAAPAVAAAPVKAPQGTRILIEALQPSWVEIADAEGNILFTNILRLGQALPIPNKPGITLTTGNASGVQIILDGKKLGPLGRTGEVKRAITLDPDKLR